MKNAINVELSADAQDWAAETGSDPSEDARRLRTGEIDSEELLSECMNQADSDREQAIREYVEGVGAAAFGEGA